MFYALYDTEKSRVLTTHAVSYGDLPFKIDDLNSFSDPIIKVGFFSSGPLYVTSSLNQVKILLSERIVKTSNNIGDILLLDKYVEPDCLKIVQIFDNMRILGSDEIVRPMNVKR